MIDTVSDASLKKHSGKKWQEWLQILNKAGARSWNHQEIVAFLKTKYKQSTWWRQVISNGYEVSVGKRIAGQSLKGTYSATLTKMIAVDQKTLWKWCCSDEGIRAWLNPMSPLQIKRGQEYEIEGGVFGEIRTIKPNQRIRLSWCELEWEKGTIVQLHVYKRAKNKSMLVIQHDGLKTARQKADMRTYWRRIIDEITERWKN